LWTEKEQLEALTRFRLELNQIQDLDILMELVLGQARRFANAEAGSIYIRDGKQLHFSYTQNEALEKRLPPGEKLIYSTFSVPIDEHSIAGYTAATGKSLNIPDVYETGSNVPCRFDPKFDQQTGYRTQSVLALPLETIRGDVVGALQIINARDENGRIIPFSGQTERLMSHFSDAAAVALERAQMTRTIILRMIRMAEMRDPRETGAHVNRVGAIAVEIYEAWALRERLPESQIRQTRDILRTAAMLHDVGKVAISDVILKKPGRFTPEEFEIMKEHTTLGARLFIDKRSEFDEVAQEIALNHHERWDGKGYPGYIDLETRAPLPDKTGPEGKPLGKKGEEIPILGRVVAVADVLDALLSRRVYKEAWEEDKALEAIREGSGTQFDPVLVDILFNRLDVIRSLRERYKDEADE
jgi:HD-GYP domain-containing protein (c-di-GMP phosphodiesterase class II)